jgi:hypothetical protein
MPVDFVAQHGDERIARPHLPPVARTLLNRNASGASLTSGGEQLVQSYAVRIVLRHRYRPPCLVFRWVAGTSDVNRQAGVLPAHSERGELTELRPTRQGDFGSGIREEIVTPRSANITPRAAEGSG